MAADPGYLDLIKGGDDTYVYLGYAVCVVQNADLYLDMLERRDSYADKRAPVAFFDGHIEWLAPGQNEVVDRIHELLPQLDAFEK